MLSRRAATRSQAAVFAHCTARYGAARPGRNGLIPRSTRERSIAIAVPMDGSAAEFPRRNAGLFIPPPACPQPLRLRWVVGRGNRELPAERRVREPDRGSVARLCDLLHRL